MCFAAASWAVGRAMGASRGDGGLGGGEHESGTRGALIASEAAWSLVCTFTLQGRTCMCTPTRSGSYSSVPNGDVCSAQHTSQHKYTDGTVSHLYIVYSCLTCVVHAQCENHVRRASLRTQRCESMWAERLPHRHWPDHEQAHHLQSAAFDSR